jgi:hypothetical protein
MIFMAEWTLAVHKAFWFPFLYLSGLEAHPLDTGWLTDRGDETGSAERWPVRKAA